MVLIWSVGQVEEFPGSSKNISVGNFMTWGLYGYNKNNWGKKKTMQWRERMGLGERLTDARNWDLLSRAKIQLQIKFAVL